VKKSRSKECVDKAEEMGRQETVRGSEGGHVLRFEDESEGVIFTSY
jgi:hypothetical protein